MGGSPKGGVREMAPRWYARDVRVYCAVSRKTDFCRVPRTKAIGSANSLAFKLPKAGSRVRARLSADSRISTTVMRATRWFVFDLSSDRDLNDALDWLGKAYDAAR